MTHRRRAVGLLPTQRGLLALFILASLSLSILQLFPIRTTLTRLAEAGLVVAMVLIAIAATWRYRHMRALLLLPVFAAFMLAGPSRPVEAALLRSAYLQQLREYSGVPYVWGGETRRGIDCSGFVRRGLIDTGLEHSVKSLNPALARHTAELWWFDSSARALGQGYRGMTVPVLEAQSINDLDHSRIEPGDLAVTIDGVHVLAYLGDQAWIEADLNSERVITINAPGNESWLKVPVRVVRWEIFAGD